MTTKTLDRSKQTLKPGIEDLNIRMAFLKKAHKFMLIAEFDTEYFKNENWSSFTFYTCKPFGTGKLARYET